MNKAANKSKMEGLEKFRRLTQESTETELNLDFNPCDLTSGDLCGVVLTFFYKLGLIQLLGLEPEGFLDFVLAVEAGYLQNPYHSFYHAADVCNFLYYILTEHGVSRCLSREDILTLMISGLCHDIGHPGVNNLYQINAKTQIASEFNEVSVLENYSCQLTSELIDTYKLFQCSTSTCTVSESILKEWITDNILATDMSFHFNHLDELSDILENWPSSMRFSCDCKAVSNCKGELASEPLRRKLCRLLLHAADISNAVRPWTLCKTWSDLAVSEFFHQGDLEKRNNLPISPNMDRSHADQPQIALDFEELIVKPYFDMLAEFIPSCCIFLKTLDDNRKKWIELKRFFPEASCELTDNLSKEKRMSFASGTVLIPTQFQTELNILSSDLTKTTDGRRLFSRTTGSLQRRGRQKGLFLSRVNSISNSFDDGLKSIVSSDSLANAKDSLAVGSPPVN